MGISLIAPSVATVNTLLTLRHNMQGLLAWFDVHARPLPWRIEKVSPWESLLAEIILQQTRMETGIPYWERIRTAYPNPAALAKDSEENLLHLWQGCGYYARARNLYKLAQTLDGKPLPKTYDELQKLPGIGPYTAAAIASICHHQPVACVDGNIRRVISRYRAEHMTDSQLQQEATELLDIDRPGDWNQAMMDLGSQVCTPRNPSCDDCPIEKKCLASKAEDPTKWPMRRSIKQKKIEAAALVIGDADGILLSAREGRSLGGLWGVPFAEGAIATEQLLHGREVEKIGTVRHDFTHKRLNVTVYTSAATPLDILTHPDTVPLSTLDKKILVLFKADKSEQS